MSEAAASPTPMKSAPAATCAWAKADLDGERVLEDVADEVLVDVQVDQERLEAAHRRGGGERPLDPAEDAQPRRRRPP